MFWVTFGLSEPLHESVWNVHLVVHGLDSLIWGFPGLHINFEPLLLLVVEMIRLKRLRTRRLLVCLC